MPLSKFQGGILGVGFNPLQAPNAPTVGTATVASGTSVSVAFTAPANVGGSAITGYAVQSTPEGISATGSSSPVTISGLTTGTAYTFRVTALNSYGPSPASASSNSVTPVVQGQQEFTTAGTYSWVAPAGVTSVSVVCVGGGGGQNGNGDGGAGGGLGWKNNITVVPGNSYTVVAASAYGGESYFINTSTVRGGGGGNANGGTFTGDGGGNGGRGGDAYSNYTAGGGGAGGYTGNGGPGANGFGGGGSSGSGGGGGGGSSSGGLYDGGYGGGGVGILGQGASGSSSGGGGSGGTNGGAPAGYNGGTGGLYGGGAGGGGGSSLAPGRGAVRIIWPGTTRQFPSTNTGNL